MSKLAIHTIICLPYSTNQQLQSVALEYSLGKKLPRNSIQKFKSPISLHTSFEHHGEFSNVDFSCSLLD